MYDIQWSITSGFGTLLTSPETLEAVYDPAGNDVENGVTLTLTAYGKGDCVGNRAQQTSKLTLARLLSILVTAAPCVLVNHLQFIMLRFKGWENENYRWVANYAQDQSNSQSPDGYFINQGKLEPTYVPGNEDINRGLVYLFLEPVNIPGSCYFTPGPVALEINSEISLSAGPNLEVCGDYGAVPLIGYSNQVEDPLVSWSVYSVNGIPVGNQIGISDTSNLETTYQPSSIEYINGISTVTLSLSAAGDFCPGDNTTDTVTITYYEPIDAFAGDIQSICGTDNSVLIDDAEILSGVNSYIDFEWKVIDGFGFGDILNKNSLRPTYVPNANDANLLNREVRLGLFINPPSFGDVTLQNGDIENFSCPPPLAPYIKSIIISEDLSGTGSIIADSVVGAGLTQHSFEVDTSATGLVGAVDFDWNYPPDATLVSDFGNMVILTFEKYVEDQFASISVVASNDCPGQQQFMSFDFEIKAALSSFQTLQTISVNLYVMRNR